MTKAVGGPLSTPATLRRELGGRYLALQVAPGRAASALSARPRTNRLVLAGQLETRALNVTSVTCCQC